MHFIRLRIRMYVHILLRPDTAATKKHADNAKYPLKLQMLRNEAQNRSETGNKRKLHETKNQITK